MIIRLALTFWFVSSAAAQAAEFSYPAAALEDRKALWSEVMVHFYGPYDKKRKCWAEKGDDLCMRPHRLDAVEEGGVAKLFLVVAGGRNGNDCHGCAGNIGLIVLEPRGEKLVVAAMNGLAEEAGAWGAAPPEEAFRVREIGKAAYGWTMETGFTAQGVTQGGEVVFGRVGDKIVDLGYIPTFSDTCGFDPDDCGAYAFDLAFGGGSGPFFDAEATLKPDSDRPKGPDRVTVPFDAGTMKYEIPEGLTFLQH